ncbi:MAG: DUF1353 domain-containing protein [Burkholderiales bacterium]
MEPEELKRDYADIAASPFPPVKVTYHTGEREWELVETYRFSIELLTFNLPQGFRFDLASIPRAVWPVIAPFDLSLVAPLTHDFIYRYAGRLPENSVIPDHTFTRKEADDLFSELMRIEGVWWWRRSLAYAAVRAFGADAWGRPIS